MQFIPPLSAILLLIGTTFSLQAIPMFGEGEGPARQKSTLVAEQEEQGRRISESSSAGEASMDQGHFYRQDGSQELQSDSVERTSISSGTAGAATDPTALPSTDEHPQASAPATTNEGSLEGHSVAAVETNQLYRHGPQGWEVKDDTGTWKTTDRFADNSKGANSSTPLDRHIAAVSAIGNNYNRSETIDKRKATFQAELCQEQRKNSSPESERRIFGLQHLIAVLEKASSYQKAMVRHLQESGSAGSISLQKSYFSKINESPNKIEKIAHQLEVNIKNLLTHQALLDIVEAHIALGNPPQHLLNTKQRLIDCISHQKASIEAKAAYATLLPPPYEVIDEATQTAIDQLALTCRKEILLARKIPIFNSALNAAFSSHYEAEARQQAAKEAQEHQPREQVITWFTQSANLYQQAAALYATGDINRGITLFMAGRCFVRAAEEAQQPQPREQVIALFTQSADRYQQAADVFATGDTKRGIALGQAGSSFIRAAEEAQEPQPREQVIALFTQSADLYQQVADAYATGDTNRGRALLDAGNCFLRAAEEAQQPQPREQVIALFTQAADLFQQAAALHATGVMTESPLLLRGAGGCFFLAAEEAQQPQPREQVIALFTQAADLFQQSSAAFETGDTNRGRALLDAGECFLRAAEEAQQPQPDQAIIDRNVRNAQGNIEKADSSGSCAIS